MLLRIVPAVRAHFKPGGDQQQFVHRKNESIGTGRFRPESAIYFLGNKNVMAKRSPQSGPPLGPST